MRIRVEFDGELRSLSEREYKGKKYYDLGVELVGGELGLVSCTEAVAKMFGKDFVKGDAVKFHATFNTEYGRLQIVDLTPTF